MSTNSNTSPFGGMGNAASAALDAGLSLAKTVGNSFSTFNNAAIQLMNGALNMIMSSAISRLAGQVVEGATQAGSALLNFGSADDSRKANKKIDENFNNFYGDQPEGSPENIKAINEDLEAQRGGHSLQVTKPGQDLAAANEQLQSKPPVNQDTLKNRRKSLKAEYKKNVEENQNDFKGLASKNQAYLSLTRGVGDVLKASNEANASVLQQFAKTMDDSERMLLSTLANLEKTDQATLQTVASVGSGFNGFQSR